ncbi:MAG: DUF3347 domain-containing protein [Chitinophagaceae bacterium]|nr:DUF3347 domain-containing protein [Chitinophagaceae bacterium]MDP1764279.1 DUF3347 domain-containing protein [Sediminibacterium sp.]MDP1810438.1 DUF3347 domain-containing protein [Sediminibacterium sp.]MDP3129071.1 DUF3347 domain-containing protein [Sediminibacterium sp.]
MKYLIISMTITLSTLAACNNSSNSTAEDIKNSDTGHTAMATATAATTNSTAASVKELVSHYLHIKNALANDDGKEAANGGKAMVESFAKFDQSALTAEQKKTYADISDDAREHAEHIGMNADMIAHQREHFSTLSKDIYDLVKTLGSGQTLYQDYCPMYNNNKGATWLSETREINNPYFGKKMPACGSIKETLQ